MAPSSSPAPTAGVSGEEPPCRGQCWRRRGGSRRGRSRGRVARTALGLSTCLGGETEIDPCLVVAQCDGGVGGIRVGGPGERVVAASQFGQVRPGVVVELRLQRAGWWRRWGTLITLAARTLAGLEGRNGSDDVVIVDRQPGQLPAAVYIADCHVGQQVVGSQCHDAGVADRHVSRAHNPSRGGSVGDRAGRRQGVACQGRPRRCCRWRPDRRRVAAER